MASATRDQHPAAAPATPRQPAAAPARAGGSGLFTLLWLIFLGGLIVEPERLDAVWSWFRDLPVVGQVAGWVLLLPLVLGLWIWQAPWAPWVRVSLIVLLAVANVITFSQPSRSRTS
jgi:hypothetical protein